MIAHDIEIHYFMLLQTEPSTKPVAPDVPLFEVEAGTAATLAHISHTGHIVRRSSTYIPEE
jgi:hypothetical protein